MHLLGRPALVATALRRIELLYIALPCVVGRVDGAVSKWYRHDGWPGVFIRHVPMRYTACAELTYEACA